MKTKVIKTERFAEIQEAVKVNDGHCPCIPIGFRSEDTKCMCKDFKEKIKAGKLGKCICGMYEVVEDGN